MVLPWSIYIEFFESLFPLLVHEWKWLMSRTRGFLWGIHIFRETRILLNLTITCQGIILQVWEVVLNSLSQLFFYRVTFEGNVALSPDYQRESCTVINFQFNTHYALGEIKILNFHNVFKGKIFTCTLCWMTLRIFWTIKICVWFFGINSLPLTYEVRRKCIAEIHHICFPDWEFGQLFDKENKLLQRWAGKNLNWG